jgi:hypothetical protein
MQQIKAPMRFSRSSAVLFWLAIGLAGCAAPATVPPVAETEGSSGLQEAMRNIPPLIMGPTVRAVDGTGPYPRPCPMAGARLEQQGGPTMEFLGQNAADPTMCRMRVGGEEAQAWYGIWVLDWAGAAEARPALKRVIEGATGVMAGFDTVATVPGPSPAQVMWHDVLRNEGMEDIPLLGRTFRAMKLSHYREGFGGNRYRSLSTVWKDMDSGVVLYGTYQHIAGRPALDGALIPAAIVLPPQP